MHTIENMTKFSEWLEGELNTRKMSQSELARLAGVTRSAVNGVLSEARGPGVDLLNGIARAFNIPPEEVFRAAGLLPPKITKTWLIDRIIEGMESLPQEEKEDVMAYIEFIRTRKKRKKE